MKPWQKWVLGAVLLLVLIGLASRPRYVVTISSYDGQQWLCETTSGRTWMYIGGRWTEVTR